MTPRCRRTIDEASRHGAGAIALGNGVQAFGIVRMTLIVRPPIDLCPRRQRRDENEEREQRGEATRSHARDHTVQRRKR